MNLHLAFYEARNSAAYWKERFELLKHELKKEHEVVQIRDQEIDRLQHYIQEEKNGLCDKGGK